MPSDEVDIIDDQVTGAITAGSEAVVILGSVETRLLLAEAFAG